MSVVSSLAGSDRPRLCVTALHIRIYFFCHTDSSQYLSRSGDTQSREKSITPLLAWLAEHALKQWEDSRSVKHISLFRVFFKDSSELECFHCFSPRISRRWIDGDVCWKLFSVGVLLDLQESLVVCVSRSEPQKDVEQSGGLHVVHVEVES